MTQFLEDTLAEARAENCNLRDEIAVLKEALKEAGDFAMKRLPHDAREHNATSEYFQAMFMTCAAESIKGRRLEENPSEPDCPTVI